MEEAARYLVMRNALMRLAREQHPASSVRAQRQQDIAREALTQIGWDFWRDKPIATLRDEIEAKRAS